MGRWALGRVAATRSCAEVVQDGRVVYADHPHLPVVPASNMKLLTATALLDRLGPSYRFTTKLESLGPPVGGVVHGNLYFVGGGDPLLRLASYAQSVPDGGDVYTNVEGLVTALQATGTRQVSGAVVGDEARYDSVRAVAGWPATYSEEGDVGALSALGIDDGFATAGPPVPDSAPPPVQSAGLLVKLLRAAGIEVGGGATSGLVPPGATVLAQVVSPPLGAELGEILKESDNTAMELLTKELGLKQRGSGSTAAGLATVRADLAADGFPLAGFVNADGSGLSRSDRVTCALLVAALERAGRRPAGARPTGGGPVGDPGRRTERDGGGRAGPCQDGDPRRRQSAVGLGPGRHRARGGQPRPGRSRGVRHRAQRPGAYPARPRGHAGRPD